MADATKLLIGGHGLLYVFVFGSICVIGMVFTNYDRYVFILKWMTLSLFAYVAALLAANVDWTDRRSQDGNEGGEEARAPRSLRQEHPRDRGALSFFWQASQEAEDVRTNRQRKPLVGAPRQATDAFRRIRADTLVGMGFSNIIALAIILTAGATLHEAGVFDVQTSAQAAEALKPSAQVRVAPARARLARRDARRFDHSSMSQTASLA